jgi:glutamate-1-semialdehyde 2,1-aminomutase
MAGVAAASGESVQILGEGPLAQLAFASVPIVDHRSWLAADHRRSRALMLELFRRGIFLNPMGTKLYLSLAHGDGAIEEFAAVLGEALLTLPRR